MGTELSDMSISTFCPDSCNSKACWPHLNLVSPVYKIKHEGHTLICPGPIKP